MPKILAIDDKQDNLITVSALLRNFIPDCTVITSDSGAEGIKKAEAEQPDTILLDVIMPEMDGFEVCRRLKSNEKTKHIPVVMLTAIKTDAGSRVKGLELGADAFLSKPIDETELVAQIKVMLRIKKAEDDLRKEKEELERRVEERTVELAKKNDHLKMEIEERKRTEEALGQSEERYRILVENSLNAIILYEQEKILFANKTFYNIFGYDSGELEGLTVDDILAPEVAEYVSEHRRRRLAGEIEKTAVYETKGRRKNGEIFDMEISVCLVAYQNKQCCMAFLSDISGRKKAEEALRESQQRFTTLFNRNPVETIVVDLEGIITEINYAKRKSNRRVPNIGDRMYIDYAAKHKIDMRSKLMKSMENREPKAFPEMWYREKCISINISPFDEGAIITSVDCTSLKYAEQKLRESEEKHKRIVGNALTGIYQVDKEGGFIMANQRIAEMFGYDSPESLMASVDSIANLYVHPEERAMILQEIDEKGSVYGKEAMFKRKTGVHFWVKYHVRVLREKGKTIYEGLMEDVTAEKSSQEAERASELRYRSLLKMLRWA